MLAIVLISILGLLHAKEDRSFGHHGKPAEYSSTAVLDGGIVKPWLKEAKNPWEEIMEIKEGIVHAWEKKKKLTAKKSIKNKIEMNPLVWIDEDKMMEFSMMDIIALGEMEKEEKSQEEEEDDLALLSIMESTPDLCPLCHKEGHSLGHEDHKKFLAKLRKEGNAPLKVTKDKETAKIMKTCKLCQAEGHALNHKDHKKINECPLCLAEGSIHNHSLHESFLAAASEFDWSFGAESKKKKAENELLMISVAEKSFKEDLLKRDIKEASFLDDLKKFFGGAKDPKDDELDLLIVEMATIPELEVFMDAAEIWGSNPFMAASRLAEPERNFHLDLDDEDGEGKPDEDEEDGEEDGRSLFDRILDGLKEWFGEESGDGICDAGRQIAIFLFVFVGLFLTTLGIYELASALMGGEDEYEKLREEELMLEMESGRKGAIAI